MSSEFKVQKNVTITMLYSKPYKPTEVLSKIYYYREEIEKLIIE